MNPGLYIHIPFCEQRCYYCAFTVAVSPEHTFAPYIDRLIREIRLSGFDEHPNTIYFGGGTPSLIDSSHLDRVLKTLRSIPPEVTIEANPGTLTESKVRQYRASGVSRISLGAQSLEDEDLRRAGRLHKSSDVLSDFKLLRTQGFDNINLDLIAGLPGQQVDIWARNVDRVLQLQPEHISIYMLDREERSAWANLPADVPDENDYADFYALAESRLESAGYVHYEISNWARPGRECAHNCGYWSGLPYRGFGVGAHSFDGTRRFWNTPALTDYAAMIDEGKLPIADQEELTPALRLQEAFMLGLRQSHGVDAREVARQLGISYSAEWHVRALQLEEEGWIHRSGSILRLTAKGRLAANSVIEELLWPTPESTASI
jgi:oxygen-independent coproporphyrinogen-3 oxidase